MTYKLQEITSNFESLQNRALQDNATSVETTRASLTNQQRAMYQSLQDSLANKTLEPQIHDFDHVTFWVGNAKQAALFYMNQFGFEPFAFRGLETGHRDGFASHVVRANNAFMQFVSSTQPNNEEHSEFVKSHGDAVKDVAFRVTNIERVVERAVMNGARLLSPICKHEFCDIFKAKVNTNTNTNNTNANTGDDNSSEESSGKQVVVKLATVSAFGDVTHTFVERNFEYVCGDASKKPLFVLPSYAESPFKKAAIHQTLPEMHILKADHVVGQFPPNKLNDMESFYCRAFGFKRFWSVDEKQIFTEHSGVKSHVVCNYNQQVMMPLCEVLLSKKAKSKAEEFVRYNNGPGIHHIAFLTNNIVQTVQNMRDRGMDFLHTPDTYYLQLSERLKNNKQLVKQQQQNSNNDCLINKLSAQIETLRKLRILVDFDEKGYLLQIFTRPINDRPTIVFEFIQRFNHNGFGAGNFLALFKAIEAEQLLRGNL